MEHLIPIGRFLFPTFGFAVIVILIGLWMRVKALEKSVKKLEGFLEGFQEEED